MDKGNLHNVQVLVPLKLVVVAETLRMLRVLSGYAAVGVQRRLGQSGEGLGHVSLEAASRVPVPQSGGIVRRHVGVVPQAEPLQNAILPLTG